jgi:hypothetical protein
MNDMSAVIQPKSDQVNADDFIGGPKTYTIEGVSISPGTEQPVQIKLIGEPRVWRPCKSMSRVLVNGWGPDAKVYPGRSVTLYRDPKVKWGGMEVGGIRVSHMSHIDREMLIQLTATKGKRAPHVVKPLAAEVKQIQTAKQTAEEWADAHIELVENAPDLEALSSIMAKGGKAMAKLEADKPELWKRVNTAYAARRAQIEAPGKAIEDTGEDFADDFDDEGEEA